MNEPGLFLARFAMLAILLALAGIAMQARLSGSITFAGRARALVACAALFGALATVWWAMASVAAMAAMPLADLDRETLLAVLDATPLGIVTELRLAALAVVLVAAAILPRWTVVALAGLAALAANAWTGHAGATEGSVGTVQRLADIAHVGGAALWLGALLTFLVAILRPAHESPGSEPVGALAAFARTGTIVVAVLAVTGGLNTLIIAREGWSPTSAWSLLLGLKLVLFGTMLGLAALNRWRLTPALAACEPGARRRLTLSLIAETSAGLAIVALVAVLAMQSPGGA